MGNIKGYVYGVATSVTFGLIPLFTLPLMNKGMHYDSILFYRFLFASIALAIMLKVTGQPFKVNRREIPVLLLLGIFYTCSAMFLLWGYDFMGAGVATALHFTYPVFVTLFMFFLFKEKTTWVSWVAILLAVAGVSVLSVKGPDLSFDAFGVFIVALSAVAYACYITAVNKSRVRTMNGRTLAFYVFIVSTVLFAIKASLSGGIQPIPDAGAWTDAILLAILPTVISNVTLVLAVRNIGGTMTSVLGAMEPLTAVAIGVMVFGESFSLQEGLGVVLIIIAVTLIILSDSVRNTVSSVYKKIRPRHA